jgi:hypothetical protein
MILAGVTVGAAAIAAWRSDAVLATPRYASILAARVKARTYTDGCQVPLLAVDSPPCRYGPGRNDTTIVLFGDSHAAHWFPAFDSLAALRGWTLVNLTKTGCPSVSVGVPNAGLGRRYLECDTWRRYAIGRIVTLRPTIVVVSNDRTYDVFVGDEQILTDSSSVARREWHEGLIRTLGGLDSSGARLVVLEDTPQARVNVPRCLVRYIDEPERCTTDARRAMNPEAEAAERLAAAAVPGAAYISMNSLICDAPNCPVIRDGIVRYQDDNHLSVRYVTSLTPELSRALSAVLAAPRAAR